MSEYKKQTVLFLCTGNSCRSQMAEGWLRHVAGDHFDALSAGLAPQPVHPLAVKVMAEIGIDISGQESKTVKQFLGHEHIHHAVFVCANAERNCPRVYPFTFDAMSWPFEDPAAFQGSESETLAKFRQVRDLIGERIKNWVAREARSHNFDLSHKETDHAANAEA